MAARRLTGPPPPTPLQIELGLTFWWDVRKLWAADLPIVEVPLAQLERILAYPFWKDGSKEVTVSGHDVAAAPEHYPAEYERTMATELAYPVNVILPSGRWTVMDGLHRLLKASLLGLETIAAKQARPRDIPKFSRLWWEPHHHP